MASIYPNTRLTNYGRELIARSQATGKKLQYIKLVTGDGQLENQNIDTMTAVLSPKLECPFTSNGEFVGDGQFRIEFAVGNSSVDSGFFARELGVYANLEGESDAAAKLIAYSNGGNYASYIPSKETPINSKVFSLDVVIGNSTNVTVKKIDAAYLTRGALDAHNRDTSAHRDLFNKKLDTSSANYIKDINKNNNGLILNRGDNSNKYIDFITANYNDSDTNKVLNLATLKGLLGQGAIVASKLDRDNGYVKFANGFIVQWGLTWFLNQNTYCDVTLPIACNVLVALCTDDSASTTTRGDEFYISWNSGYSTSGNRTSIRFLTNRGSAGNFTWLCIGRA